MVVILGVSETGLGAMRSLGKRGFSCWGVDARFDHPGFSSRYCQRRVCVSGDVSAPELAVVLAEIASLAPTRPVLLPTSDRFVRLVNGLRDELSASFDLAIPPREIVEDLLDKERFAALAERAGLRVPRTAARLANGSLAEAIDRVGLPAVVKPRASDRRPVGLPKAVVLQSPEEARRFVQRHGSLPATGLSVQEYVPGGDPCHLSVAAALDAGSRPVAIFVAQKRRQGNHGAGVGTFVQSHPDAEAAEVARRFLQRIGYVGVAEVELKRHGVTGEIFAIEVNPRLWSQAMLPAALGIDFALLAYRIARGSVLTGEMSAPERAVSWQDLWGDSYWTFRPNGYFWRGDVSASTWIAQTLTSRARPFFEWRDPVPALVHLWQEAAGAAVKVSR